jgi:hypothetical protein
VDRPPQRKHPQVEKKEDTVGRVTMINGAMSNTDGVISLFVHGLSSILRCNRTLLEHLSIIMC